MTSPKNDPKPEVTIGADPETLPEGDTFDRAYVEKLRKEAGDFRVKAKRADDLAARLLSVTLTAATAGILADPTDLPTEGDYFDADGFPDPAKIAEAAKALTETKPHLADRRPTEPVEQGARGDATKVDLAGMVRQLAG